MKNLLIVEMFITTAPKIIFIWYVMNLQIAIKDPRMLIETKLEYKYAIVASTSPLLPGVIGSNEIITMIS